MALSAADDPQWLTPHEAIAACERLFVADAGGARRMLVQLAADDFVRAWCVRFVRRVFDEHSLDPRHVALLTTLHRNIGATRESGADAMAEIESRDDGIAVTMKRAEAAALAAIAEIGLDADDALPDRRHTATAERALRELRASRWRRYAATAGGRGAHRRRGHSVSPSQLPRGSFLASFQGVDIAAANWGYDQLKGALR